MSVAVVGDSPFVTCFELVGAIGYRVANGAEASSILKSIIEEGKFKVVILPEKFAKDTAEVRASIAKKGKLWPVFALLPDISGKKGMRLEELKSLVSLAVGAELEL